MPDQSATFPGCPRPVVEELLPERLDQLRLFLVDASGVATEVFALERGGGAEAAPELAP
jgi:hypothetical protein